MAGGRGTSRDPWLRMPPRFLRNSRKTQCGANQFLAHFEVRTAPFALLRECGTAPSVMWPQWCPGSPVAPVLLCPLYWFQPLAGFVPQKTNFGRPREWMAGGLVVGGETDDANDESPCRDRIDCVLRGTARLDWEGLDGERGNGWTWAGTHGSSGSADRCFAASARSGRDVASDEQPASAPWAGDS